MAEIAEWMGIKIVPDDSAKIPYLRATFIRAGQRIEQRVYMMPGGEVRKMESTDGGEFVLVASGTLKAPVEE